LPNLRENQISCKIADPADEQFVSARNLTKYIDKIVNKMLNISSLHIATRVCAAELEASRNYTLHSHDDNDRWKEHKEIYPTQPHKQMDGTWKG